MSLSQRASSKPELAPLILAVDNQIELGRVRRQVPELFDRLKFIPPRLEPFDVLVAILDRS